MHTRARWLLGALMFCALIVSAPGTALALSHKLKVSSTPDPGVTIVGVPAATGKGTDYSVWVADSTAVTLTAPATDLSARPFVRWRLNGVDQPDGTLALAFTMDQAHTAIACYALWTLKIQVPDGFGPTGSGATAPATGTIGICVGVGVTVTATPLADFKKWRGNAVPPGMATTNPITIPTGTEGQLKKLRAVFPDQWSLKVQVPDGTGATSPATGKTQVFVGDSIAVTATPAAGLLEWRGNAVPAGKEQDNPITIPTGTSGQMKKLRAVFPPQWALRIQVPDGTGTTDPATGLHVMFVGTDAVVTASPAAQFSHWEDVDVPPGAEFDNPLTVPSGTEGQEKKIRAVFPPFWTLRVQVPDGANGTTDPPTGNAIYWVGDDAVVTASPGAYFEEWRGNAPPAGLEENNPITIPTGTASQVKTIRAFFPDAWILRVLAPNILGSGTTADPVQGLNVFFVGDDAVVTATASGGFAFTHWTGTGVPPGESTSNPITIPSGAVDEEKSLRANYVAL